MIWKMSPQQEIQVRRLIPRCCNWENGQCMALNMPCPQELSISRINCIHFRTSVLPAEKELYNEIIRNNGGNDK